MDVKKNGADLLAVAHTVNPESRIQCGKLSVSLKVPPVFFIREKIKQNKKFRIKKKKSIF